jgi:2-dehydro-3-deoxyphosphogluconate aldolase/(4S)-4-hydroxy-2-oxoglutarate aldolase
MIAPRIDETTWRAQSIIPVLTVETTKEALFVGHILLQSGFAIVEVTLRTPAALDAIAALSGEVSGLTVGAGTVCGPSDIAAALKAGARFLVSPGQTGELLAAGRSAVVPYIPGGTTASEFLAIRAAGYSVAKFFPAESAGGVKALAALAGPLFDMSFIPTGGIEQANFAAYLSLPSVMAVGGSWIVPKDKIKAGDAEAIRALCKAARSLADKQV